MGLNSKQENEIKIYTICVDLRIRTNQYMCNFEAYHMWSVCQTKEQNLINQMDI
jgi:hypothetical protein